MFWEKGGVNFGGMKNKVTIPQKFIDWSESLGFDPEDAAKFVLSWFCEKENLFDKCVGVQYTYTCNNVKPEGKE